MVLKKLYGNGGGIPPRKNSNIPITYRGSTYNVNPTLIRQIAGSAKGSGIDPYTALSIGYQESGLDVNGPYHLNPDYYGSPFGNAGSGIESIDRQMKYARNLQNRGVIPQGEDYTIQGYNGYGTIWPGHADLEGASKIYGTRIPASGLNLRKNPLYGKRIIDVRNNAIKNNPQVVQEVEDAIPLYKPTDTQYLKKTRRFGGLIKPFA